MKVKFILQDIKEARIIKGLFEDNNIETKIYSELESIYKDDSDCDIIFIDSRVIEEVPWDSKIKGNPHLVIIVPSWSRDTKRMEEKSGFRSITYIRRPLTPQDLLEYCLKLVKNNT